MVTSANESLTGVHFSAEAHLLEKPHPMHLLMKLLCGGMLAALLLACGQDGDIHHAIETAAAFSGSTFRKTKPPAVAA